MGILGANALLSTDNMPKLINLNLFNNAVRLYDMQLCEKPSITSQLVYLNLSKTSN